MAYGTILGMVEYIDRETLGAIIWNCYVVFTFDIDSIYWRALMNMTGPLWFNSYLYDSIPTNFFVFFNTSHVLGEFNKYINFCMNQLILIYVPVWRGWRDWKVEFFMFETLVIVYLLTHLNDAMFMSLSISLLFDLMKIHLGIFFPTNKSI